MTDSFAQAMVFFLVVLFGLGLTFPVVAYYKEKPKLKKLGYLFMVLFSLLLVFCLLRWFAVCLTTSLKNGVPHSKICF